MAVREKTSGTALLDASRAELRRQLNHYLERQRIGVSSLRQQIAETTGRASGDLTDQALLRFLAGREADEKIAARCAAFIEQADQPDPVIAFGDALCAFQQCDASEDRLAFVSGVYEVTGHLQPIKGYPFKDPEVPYGVIRFEPVAGRPYLRAVETTGDRTFGKRRGVPGEDHVFEGVALVQAQGVSAVLRETLTRRPKSYVLDRQAAGRPGRFSGVVTSPAYDGRTGAGGVVLDVTLDLVSAASDEG